jgi:hypothetical protein
MIRTAIVTQERRKSNAFSLTIKGGTKTKVVLRYVTEHNAARGAVRQCRDWLKAGKDRRVKILLPDGRMRYGTIAPNGTALLTNITNAKK